MIRRTWIAALVSVMLIVTWAYAGDTPTSIPSDRNGKQVALQYWQQDNDVSVPVRQYEEQTLRASAALVGATGRSNGTAVTGLGQYRTAVIYLDVTAMTRPDADETLDVTIETSYDGGTTWLRIAAFTQVAATGAQTQILVLDQGGDTTPVADPDDTDPASGVISLGAFGDQMRTASTYTDPANANGTSTFSVVAAFKK